MSLRIFLIAGSLLFGFSSWLTSASAEEAPPTATFKDDFEKGVERWSGFDPKQWQAKKTDKGQVLSLFEKKTSYKPPHRSPTNIALLKDVVAGDFTFDGKVLSTHKDYGHRDVCVVFGYQDPSHFYYVHLAKAADDHANQIFIVNGAPRKKISITTTKGTDWDDNWHHVRVVRKVKEGTIEIFFDNMEKPVMTAKDTTFAHGQFGVGTFDDTCDWDDIAITYTPVKK